MKAVLEFIRALWPILTRTWVSVVLTILFCIVIISVPQAKEVLIGLAGSVQDADSLLRPDYGVRLLLFVLVLSIFSLNAWYFARFALYAWPLPLEVSRISNAQVTEWLEAVFPRSLTLLPPLAVIIAIVRIFWDYPNLSSGTQLNLFLLVVTVTCAGALVCRFAIRRRHYRIMFAMHSLQEISKQQRAAKQAEPPMQQDRPLRWSGLSWPTRLAVSMFLVFVVLFLAIFVLLPEHARLFLEIGDMQIGLDVASMFLLWASGMIGIASVLNYLSALWRVPLILLLVVLALVFAAFNFNDNHSVWQIRTASQVATGRPGLADAFEAWIRPRLADWSKHHPDKRYPVFIVAAEGGGARAGHWTAIVLGTLQDHCPQFAQHVFAISGVSGGSVGAAVFAASMAWRDGRLTTELCRAHGNANRYHRQVADRFFQQDLLSPLLTAALFPDLVQRFLPYPFGMLDRARAFERGMESAWRLAVRDIEGRSGGDPAAGDGWFAKSLAELRPASCLSSVP